jgi:hypothetical protein
MPAAIPKPTRHALTPPVLLSDNPPIELRHCPGGEKNAIHHSIAAEAPKNIVANQSPLPGRPDAISNSRAAVTTQISARRYAIAGGVRNPGGRVKPA